MKYLLFIFFVWLGIVFIILGISSPFAVDIFFGILFGPIFIMIGIGSIVMGIEHLKE